MIYKKSLMAFFLLLLAIIGLPVTALASSSGSQMHLNALSSHWALAALIVFIITYLLVMVEEVTHLRKSKPAILGAGIIWVIVAIVAVSKGQSHIVKTNLEHSLLEYGELFLFLLTAMTYINVLEERNVFRVLRAFLINRGLGYRGVFWLTGVFAFFLSPMADNLTTALVMCSVVMAIGGNNHRFVLLSCINVVVAANAGGAFSPFGDITTLMIWQSGIIPFKYFFTLFVPSVVNFMIPAIIFHFFIPKANPQVEREEVMLKYGARRIILLFLLTITTAVSFENFLHLPPALGMMTGLSYLMFFSYYIKEVRHNHPKNITDGERFEIFKKVANAEWDTLLFFYGILLAVQGLATLGYLSILSSYIYQSAPVILPTLMDVQTQANAFVGILSAIIDNIPVMFAVLTMNPDMSVGQWLLVTLTAGVGGSLLSIGSAAGVAVMGQSKGKYTFIGHLKWSWAILLGYIASIAVHLWVNSSYFDVLVQHL
ncbi:sodium:proton antiporter NhaD [Thiotrichales bacterium 19S9-12]|nr:sodium:proton antiporter NhaD [Thiotrichales bacterium 19S9-11]MCF6811417.1 sodium:proton antiporter NhaD [Thiotrichales bacterium 19S9-12]